MGQHAKNINPQTGLKFGRTPTKYVKHHATLLDGWVESYRKECLERKAAEDKAAQEKRLKEVEAAAILLKKANEEQELLAEIAKDEVKHDIVDAINTANNAIEKAGE